MIHFDDAVRFFENMVPELSCTVCGHDSFEIMMNTENQDTEVSFLLAEQGQIPVIHTTCSACAHITQFNGLVIAKWVEENPAEG